ncbi:MAG: Fic family protein, partial [Chloroflexi bacterium]|nr:Fic family protein [Chloroflexota bacterium]
MDLVELLKQVDELKVEIDALRPIDPEQEQRIMQKFRLDWTYHSNAIEGNTLSFGETKAFLLHDVTAQGKPFRDYLDIKGHHKALDYLLDIIRQQAPLTEAAVRELHKIILVEPYDVDAETLDGRSTKRRIIPGQYKSMPNHVRTSTGEVHYYASPEETPSKMADLMAWYRHELVEKNELHPLILAATFHYQFVTIHPFDDGNGRMARLLMNLILMQAGYPPVVVPLDTKNEYLLALEQADANNELTPFIGLVGQALLKSLDL